ncbi:MAG: elongation factor P maturation arginine rhamnosyltransferase EarP [Treponema sp.]|nr:elongation factor P maturation arginine rhamnosyltransferase EarP [Treponema sp.]
MDSVLDITLLCKVVDNFGDIGVVYRLARALTDISKGGESLPLVGTSLPPTPSAGDDSSPATPPKLNLRIIADNLESFRLLCPQIDPAKEEQTVNGWQIYNWNAGTTCLNAFRKKQPRIIIECFQCGRPDWLETLLFTEKVPDVVHIIMLDYLTAEDYAETFHKLKSLTRSARVQKVNFMPGFTQKTSGLILDKPFMESLNARGCRIDSKSIAAGVHAECTNGGSPSAESKESFNAVFFSYPRDWTPAVRALQKFNKEKANGALNVLLARGAGYESFLNAYTKCADSKVSAGKQLFTLTELNFLPQTEWDSLLTRTPLLFIRGEDSLSRACLCGVPFVWHAYPQTEEYQLVKVQALLERMRPHFAPQDFEHVERCWQIYNTTNASARDLEDSLYGFLRAYSDLKLGFADFSASLLKNGDLATHLLEFIEESKTF